MVPTDRDAGQAGCAGVGCDMKSSTVVAQEGVLLLGISLIITILGMHMFHRFRGKPINSSVAGLLIGIGTGALVSFFWLSVTRSSPHSSIQLDNKVCSPRCSMPCYNIICSIAWSSNRIVGTVLLHILATVIERLPTLSLSLSQTYQYAHHVATALLSQGHAKQYFGTLPMHVFLTALMQGGEQVVDLSNMHNSRPSYLNVRKLTLKSTPMGHGTAQRVHGVRTRLSTAICPACAVGSSKYGANVHSAFPSPV
jgi:hypothetical protein